MTKFFSNKNILQKIIIIFVVIILIQFVIAPYRVQAANSIVYVVGSMFLSIFVMIADGCMMLLEKLINPTTTNIFVTIDLNKFSWKGLITTGIGAFAGGIGTAKLAGAVGAGVTKILGLWEITWALSNPWLLTIAVAGAVVGGLVGALILNKKLPDAELRLPISGITPKEIFNNEIMLLDINFFEPMESRKYPQYEYIVHESLTKKAIDSINDSAEIPYEMKADIIAKTQSKEEEALTKIEEKQLPEKEIRSTADVLKEHIANWYAVLRTAALVGLLSVLVFVGVRVVISSSLDEKAKYKSMITDWVVAIVLLYVMHYIMAFSTMLVARIVNGISISTNTEIVAIIPDSQRFIEETGS